MDFKCFTDNPEGSDPLTHRAHTHTKKQKTISGQNTHKRLAHTSYHKLVDKIHDRIPTWLFCDEKLDKVMKKLDTD